MGIRDFSYIIFGPSSFSSLPHRARGIALELANEGADVEYIEFPPSRVGRLRDLVDRAFRKSAIERSEITDYLPISLRVHTPPVLPLSVRNSVTPFWDKRKFQQWFRGRIHQKKSRQTVAWIMMPLWWGWFVDHKLLSANFVVYDVADDLHVFSTSPYSHWRMQISERLLARHIDLVTYSAGQMEETIRDRFPLPATQFLPNAIGTPFSQLAAEESLTASSVKRIGFVGIISDRWIDIDLLCKVANTYPDYELWIVGPIDSSNAQKLMQYPNVRLKGLMPHTEIAELVPSFNVALIPFKNNSITRVVNPLKLYEYAAAGIPIVAMNTAELQQYSKLIYLSTDSHEFLSNIHLALNEASLTTRAERKKFALQNTWRTRIITFEQALNIINL